MQIRIIEGRNRIRFANVTSRGIRIGMERTRYIPCELRPLAGSSDAGNALGGAIVGNMLMGSVGAAIGAFASRGRTGFVMQTLQGRELIGEVESSRYTELYAEVERFKREMPTLEQARAKPLRWKGFARRLLLGPFDFWRMGWPWFAGALAFVVLTWGWGWPILPFAGKLADRLRPSRDDQRAG